MNIKDNPIASEVLIRAKSWTQEPFDVDTRTKVQNMISSNTEELIESFHKYLEFGTGGMRGIMGPGTNRINNYTLAIATQGLCNYVLKNANGELSIAIAYDSRNNSKTFARNIAEVISANGIKAWLFEDLRPTPELSFAIRELKCSAGIVITASHNPKEYNGYKVYWNDGGQLVAPHDKNVLNEVNSLQIQDVNFSANENLIFDLGREMDEKYISRIQELSLQRFWTKGGSDLKIVYTSLHGTGISMVPEVLKKFGFSNVNFVDSQSEPDGNFPTVESPNPEEAAALNEGIKLAEKIGADIVLGTDPDSDRVGIAVKNNSGDFILLNGNQIASVLISYLLENKKDIKPNDYVVKTVVTTDLIQNICTAFDVPCYETLTGFKYIAEQIRLRENKGKFIGGGEESYGYLVGDFVRDKDAIISVAMICEIAAFAQNRNSSFYNELLKVYSKYGYFLESLKSVTLKGIKGMEEISAIMSNYREKPPLGVGGTKVVGISDYQASIHIDVVTGKRTELTLPKSNVLQFFLEDKSRITIRPSGTEPKIKYYFGVTSVDSKSSDSGGILTRLENKLKLLEKEF